MLIQPPHFLAFVEAHAENLQVGSSDWATQECFITVSLYQTGAGQMPFLKQNAISDQTWRVA